MTEIHDVCVAGLGAWGASAALALAGRGLSVVAVDPFDPPHEHGSHTGRTRLARRSAHEGDGYTTLTARAFHLWDSIDREHGSPLLTTTGALLLDLADGPLIAPSRRTLLNGGWPFELLDPSSTRERWPGVRLEDNEACLYEPGAQVLDAPAAVAALGASARRAGVDVRTGTRLVDWRTTYDSIAIQLSGGTAVRARRLVLCVGNRAPELAGTDWPLDVERQVLLTYRLPGALVGLPAIFAVDDQLGPRSGFYGCPEPGQSYKVALHHEGQTGAPAELQSSVTSDDLHRVAEVVARRLPALTGTVLDAKVCTYTNSPDHDWIIDRHPTDARVIVATGDSGRGFRYAPAVGELIAEAVVDGPECIPDVLRAARFLHV